MEDNPSTPLEPGQESTPETTSRSSRRRRGVEISSLSTVPITASSSLLQAETLAVTVSAVAKPGAQENSDVSASSTPTPTPNTAADKYMARVCQICDEIGAEDVAIEYNQQQFTALQTLRSFDHAVRPQLRTANPNLTHAQLSLLLKAKWRHFCAINPYRRKDQEGVQIVYYNLLHSIFGTYRMFICILEHKAYVIII